MFQKYRHVSVIFILILFLGMKINVNAEEKAIVTLESYEVSNGVIAPGETVRLSLTFINKSKETDAENVSIKAYNVNRQAYPVFGESNQFYIGHLRAGSQFTKEVEFVVSEKIVSEEVLQLNFITSYRDKVTGDTSDEIIIAVPITEGYELKINSINALNDFEKLNSGKINIEYENTGQLHINNLFFRLTGNIKNKEMIYTAESLNTGIMNDIDCYIEFIEKGEQTLTVNALYYNKDGDEQILDSKSISVNVLEHTGNNKLDQLKNNNNKSLVYIEQAFLTIGSLIIILIIIIWKNKKVRLSNRMKED